MRSRLGSWAASLVESTCLVAIVTVPIFFNFYSHESFEPDKIYVLRALTAVTLAALIVWWCDAGRAAWTVAGNSLWRTPLVVAVLASMGAYAIAAAGSIAPRLSLMGSYLRAQGTYTFASYTTVFLGVALIVRAPACRARLVTAMLLATVPVSLYALIQQFGADPIDWGLDATDRATSTAGNPIFLSAYLLMVIPLTLARLLRPSSGGGRWTWRDATRAAPYAALLILQVAAFLCARSRGPMVGIVFSLAAFVAFAALLYRARWPVLALGGIAALALAATLTSRAPTTATEARGVARLARVFALHEGSGRVRTIIWEGVIDLLRRDPLRAVVGYGPETMLMVFPPVYPAELSSYERPSSAPDRAHNEILDTLVSTGAIGCGAEIALFVAFVVSALHSLGILPTLWRRRWFLVVALGGAAVGALVPVIAGRTALAGLGFGLGFATSVLAYLIALALWRAPRSGLIASDDGLLLAALVAAGVGHFAEMQAGLGIGVTRLYFFACAGLVVGIGARGVERTPSPETGVTAQAALLVLGLIVSLLLVLLTFDFCAVNVDLRLHAAAIGALLLVTWLFGTAVAFAESPGQWRRDVGLYMAVSLGPWMLFAMAFVPAVRAVAENTARAGVDALGSQLTGLVALAYAGVFAIAFLIAAGLTWGRAGGDIWWWRRWQAAVVGVPVMVIALGAAVATLGAARADTFAKLGASYEQARAWSQAIRAHEVAFAALPWRQEYAVNLARALIERARQAANSSAEERDTDATRALALTEQMANAYPLNTDHQSNLARIYRKWARVGDGTQRAARWERADAAYERALARWPTNTVLWNERALLYLERGQPEQMWETFDHSLRINPHFVETYVRRARVFVALQRFDDATADYRRARRVYPGVPLDAPTLAELYQETRQTERALADARAGLAEATAEELPFLQRLVDLLEASRQTPATGS